MNDKPDTQERRPNRDWEFAVRWLRRQPDKGKIVVDCYFDDPLQDVVQRYHASEEWQAIKLLLKGFTGKALDVGAGRGIASYALAKEGFEVVALEPDPSSLVGADAIRGLVQDVGLSINVVQQFSERLPFPDPTFDVIFARAVLHHTHDLSAACREFSRVLRPGGLMIAVREHVISSKNDLPAFLEKHPLNHLYGGENELLLSDYLSAIKDAGFKIIKVLNPWETPINYYPYDIHSLQIAIASRIRIKPKIFLLLMSLPGV